MENISCSASEITTNKLYEMQFQHEFKLCEAIVTKDVGDYEVAVGVPAKVVKKLDQKKFEK
jgi:hypothetical protein